MSTENVNEVVEETVETQEEVKTYTQDELDKLLQQEGDKRTSQALTTAKAKWEEEFQQKLEVEKSEAEKLAKLSSEERYAAELAKERESFETEKLQFQKERLENQTIKELSQSGLPVSFAPYLLADNADSIKSNIDEFKTQWTNAIEAAVNERLKGNTPSSSNVQGGTMSKQEFAKLDYHARAKMMKDNPEAVKQILASK